MLKMLLGLLAVLTGIAVGLYVGVWVCLVGGVVMVVDQLKAPTTDSLMVAIGIARVLMAGVAGWIAAAGFIIPGAWIIRRV